MHHCRRLIEIQVLELNSTVFVILGIHSREVVWNTMLGWNSLFVRRIGGSQMLERLLVCVEGVGSESMVVSMACETGKRETSFGNHGVGVVVILESEKLWRDTAIIKTMFMIL